MRGLSILIVCSIFIVSACTSVSTETNSEAEIATPTQSNTADDSSVHSNARVVTYYGDVDTTEWKTYRNDTMKFELQYPPTFEVIESVDSVTIQRISETISDQIVFSTFKSTLEKVAGEQFRGAHRLDHGGLTIRDNNVNALVAYFQSGDAYSWFLTYFLIPDMHYPETAATRQTVPYDIIRAVVQAFPIDEMQAAQEMGMLERMGPEEILSIPQQILSTFKFL